MYQIAPTMPAPYSFQAPAATANTCSLPAQHAPSVAPQSYSHGGRTKRARMIMAHMSPKELDVLDHLQGKVEKCPRSGMRSYSHLEEILKNPHILSQVHSHSQKHAKRFAEGGRVDGGHDYGDPHLNHMAMSGQHGDKELALIGPHTRHIFDQLAGGGQPHPEDGRPQYFSLGGLLGGLWDGVKGVAQAAAPVLGSVGKALLPTATQMGGAMLGSKFGPFGQMAAQGLGNLADRGLTAMENSGGGPSAMGRTLGEGINAAGQAKMGGANWGQSFGHGMNQMGSRFGGATGGAMQGLGQSMANNQGLRQTAMNTAKGGFQGAGGMGGVRDAAYNLMQHQQMGGMGGLRQGAKQMAMNTMPTNESMYNQDAYNQLPFGYR